MARKLSFNKKRRFFLIRKVAVSNNQHRWPTNLKEPDSTHRSLKLVLFYILTGLTVYVLFFSAWFNVRAIEVAGSDAGIKRGLYDRINSILNQRSRLLLSNGNIFLFKITNVDQIKKEMGLADVTWDKNFFDRAIYVRYQNRQPVAVLARQGGQFYIDFKGEVIAPADPNDLHLKLPLIFLAQDDISPGTVNENLIKSVAKISGKADDLSLKIVAFSIDNSPEIGLKTAKDSGEAQAVTVSNATGQKDKAAEVNLLPIKELIAITSLGWKIYFGEGAFESKNDLDSQLFNLEEFIKVKFKKTNPRNLKYLDLRFGEKIFYK